MRVLVVGVPDSEFADFIFTKWIVKVRELSKDSCMVIMADGSKYSFAKPAQWVVDQIAGDDEFINVPAGTDVLQ